jgi:hypothetical protein
MSYPVTIDVNGRTVRGTYAILGTMITVSTGSGFKTAHVGNMNTERLAKILLREFAGSEAALKHGLREDVVEL